MEIKILEACRNDAETIIDFQQKMAVETEGMVLDPIIISSGVNAVFKDPSKGRYYIAADNNKVVASLLITYEWSDWRNSYIWWFQSVYVLPEYRRKGIFSRMYDFIKYLALSNKVAGLRLYVESDNRTAMKTYEAMGMNGDHYKLFEWLK
ncbi:MAG: GNAT family N-acetyltransferase [Marinilabiliaceae bacterium]|jgi:GNAT superfamily N-acetyltransferase|nr:GNAT family N-acetyltransferase [Marinilabiliaceae bacterium]